MSILTSFAGLRARDSVCRLRRPSFKMLLMLKTFSGDLQETVRYNHRAWFNFFFFFWMEVELMIDWWVLGGGWNEEETRGVKILCICGFKDLFKKKKNCSPLLNSTSAFTKRLHWCSSWHDFLITLSGQKYTDPLRGENMLQVGME